MLVNAEVCDFVRKDGGLVQIQAVDQQNQTYSASDGGVLGISEVGLDDVLLESEIETW